VQLVGDGEPHELVPGRVELHLVDPVAEPVVRAQDGRVPLGPPRVLARLDAPRCGAGLAGALDAPLAALAHQCLAKRQIDFEQVDRLERRRLIHDLARRIAARCRRLGRRRVRGRAGLRWTRLDRRHAFVPLVA